MSNVVVTKDANKPTWTVRLENRVVGKITFVDVPDQGSYYQYAPKGSKLRGDKFAWLDSCIKSLGDEE